MTNFFEAKDSLIYCIKQLFLANVRDEEKSRSYFWKWISTRDIAYNLGWSLSKTRYWLNKLDPKFVHSKRDSNWCSWALNEIDGFRQHKFNDYYEKA